MSSLSVHVDARRMPSDYSVVWVGTYLVGTVADMAELVGLLSEIDVDLEAVDWAPGSREDLTGAARPQVRAPAPLVPALTF